MTAGEVRSEGRPVSPAGRIEIIDALRGLSIILMVFYHFGVDMVSFGYLPKWVIYNPLLGFLQPFFAGVFIMLSGVSSRFSRSNIKRGLMILCLALLVTAATLIYSWLIGDYAVVVTFGILHFLAFAIILYGLLGKYIDRIPGRMAPFLYAALFAASYIFLPVFVPFYGLSIFGFLSPVFYTADYFAVFPWIFCFLFGTWLGKPIREGRFPDWFYSMKIPFFPWVGRHTLIVYVLHQPALTGLMLLLGALSAG